MPAEHGGWGLTLEPGLLGFLAAPSIAGLLLGVAALLVFLVRTPLRLMVIGRRSGPAPRSAMSTRRTHLATRVASIELAGLVVAIVLAAGLATDPLWWLPVVIAAPLLAIALWYDMRSLSRRLIPEIAGSLAIASVAAMGAAAGGADWALAVGLWAILAARILSSIPHVRAQILRIHGRPPASTPLLVGDIAALVTAAIAMLLDTRLVPGALAIVGLIVIQHLTLARPPRPAKILGVRQMILGFSVVGVTVVGVWLL